MARKTMRASKQHVQVSLQPHDCTSFSVIARVRKGLLEGGYDELANEFTRLTLDKDRANTIQIAKRFVTLASWMGNAGKVKCPPRFFGRMFRSC